MKNMDGQECLLLLIVSIGFGKIVSWLDKANSRTKMDIVPSYLRPWQTKVIRFGMSSLGF
jgi:hypothetical protein